MFSVRTNGDASMIIFCDEYGMKTIAETMWSVVFILYTVRQARDVYQNNIFKIYISTNIYYSYDIRFLDRKPR